MNICRAMGLLFALVLASCASKKPELQSNPVTPVVLTSVPAASNSADSSTESGTEIKTPSLPAPSPEKIFQLAELCQKELKSFPGKMDAKVLKEACEQVQLLPECQSVQGTPLFHFDKKGDAKKPANILVISLIHGDEVPAGSVGRFWMERLQTIVPRNNWRVIPVLNPDGVAQKTRTNANKVDLNRNFPTADWDEKAQKFWKKEGKASPRRFPGKSAASEPELKCVLTHLEDFKPDFIVSIHTPLRVLDYDGPKVKPPKFDYLPWKSLGHYPGSLGRYMWFERKVPVLTMELKEDLPQSNDPWLQLQDIIGVLVGLENMSEKERAHIQTK